MLWNGTNSVTEDDHGERESEERREGIWRTRRAVRFVIYDNSMFYLLCFPACLRHDDVLRMLAFLVYSPHHSMTAQSSSQRKIGVRQILHAEDECGRGMD